MTAKILAQSTRFARHQSDALIIAALLLTLGCNLTSPLDEVDYGNNPNPSGGSSNTNSGGTTGNAGSGNTGVGNTGNGGGEEDGGTASGGNAGGGNVEPQCQDIELLSDGNLDGVPGTTWAESSLNGYPIVLDEVTLTDVLVPQSGTQAAWLGGTPYEEASISQIVSIPDGTVALTVSGYYGVVTEDFGTGDFASVYLLDELGENSNVLASWNASEPMVPWEPFGDSYDASELAGTDWAFVVGCSTDAEFNTSFFVDTLSLVATVCE